jgi:cation:H+ antiporter
VTTLDAERCPACGEDTKLRWVDSTLTTDTWTCRECGLNWVIEVINPVTAVPSNRAWLSLRPALVFVAGLPGASLGAANQLNLLQLQLPPVLAAMVFGVAMVSAAFMLCWAAEAAQVDYGTGLALALLVVLAILPEYAVDFVFTFKAGQIYEQHGACIPQPDATDPCSMVTANMTGSNRLLVGVGWPLVVLVASLRALRNRKTDGGLDSDTLPGKVRLPPKMSAEVVFLGIATLYAFTLPLRHTLTLLDGWVLVTIWAFYFWRLSQAPAEKPHLEGVAAWIGNQPRLRRCILYWTFYAVALLVIMAAAEPFSTSLESTASQLDFNKFRLVQWIAPLASESPELIVACLYAGWLAAPKSLSELLASKVSQWSLLVGTLPVVFAVSAVTTDGLPLNTQQRFELLLTATQSLFAVALLVNLTLTVFGAVALLTLFSVQYVSSIRLSPAADQVVIVVQCAVYVVLAIGLLIWRHKRALQLIRDGLITPFPALVRVDGSDDEIVSSSGDAATPAPTGSEAASTTPKFRTGGFN